MMVRCFQTIRLPPHAAQRFRSDAESISYDKSATINRCSAIPKRSYPIAVSYSESSSTGNDAKGSLILRPRTRAHAESG